MIKHGPIMKKYGKTQIAKHSHLAAIAEYVTKGICDAKENVVIQPQACDVKGAKQFSSQHCVIARAFNRTFKPEAIAVGRSTAFAVFNGLAVRFLLRKATTKLVDEFDLKGRVRRAPFTLFAANPANTLVGKDKKQHMKKTKSKEKAKRIRRLNVRAVGGGVRISA